MPVRLLIAVLLIALIAPAAYAQGDDPPQHFDDPVSGVSFDMPAGWVAEAFGSILFIANSDESMDANQVGPGHLFITLQVEPLEDWAEFLPADVIDGDAPLTALTVAENYPAYYKGFEGSFDGPPEPLPVDEVPADETAPDAAYMRGGGLLYEGMIVVIVPDAETIIHMQANAVAGEFDPYAETVLALAASLRYAGPGDPPETPALPRYEGERLSFDLREGFQVIEELGAGGETLLILVNADEAAIPGSLPIEVIQYELRLLPASDLPEELVIDPDDLGRGTCDAYQHFYPAGLFFDWATDPLVSDAPHGFCLASLDNNMASFYVFYPDAETLLTLAIFRGKDSRFTPGYGGLPESLIVDGVPLIVAE